MTSKFNYSTSQQFKTILLPPKDLDGAAWAEENVIIPNGPRPGRLRLKRWQHKILSKIGRGKTIYHIVQSSAQQGKSTILAICILYCLFHLQQPAFLCFPDEKSAIKFYRGTLQKIILSSPNLLAQVVWNRTNVNKQELNTIAGVTLRIAHASSATSLSSFPAACIALDEVAKMDTTTSGGDEAGPVSLAEARMLSYLQMSPTFMCVSTPTKDTSELGRLLRDSENFEWKFNCPGCNSLIGCTFKNLQFNSKAKLKNVENGKEPIAFKCLEKGCEHTLTEMEFRRAVETGDWHTTNLLDTMEEQEQAKEGEPTDQTKAEKSAISNGYFVHGIMSETMDFKYIVSKFMKIKGDFERLKHWKNSICGETFGDENVKVTKRLLEQLTDKAPDALDLDPTEYLTPSDTLTIIAGVDVGKSEKEGDYHFHTVLIAVRPNNNFHILDYQRVLGKANLKAFLEREFTRADGNGTIMPEYGYIDTGYDATYVYSVCQEVPGLRAVKGQQKCFPPFSPKDINSRRAYGQDYTLDFTIRLGHVNTNYFKEMFFNYLDNKQIRFSAFTPDAVYEHIQNEKKKVVNGKLVFSRVYQNAPNHSLDCLVYGLAGAWELNLGVYGSLQDYLATNSSNTLVQPEAWSMEPQAGITY